MKDNNNYSLVNYELTFEEEEFFDWLEKYLEIIKNIDGNIKNYVKEELKYYDSVNRRSNNSDK